MPSPRRVSLALLLLVGGVYMASLLPGVRGGAGTIPLLDTWANTIFDAGVVVALVVRGLDDRRERVVWWTLAAGLTSALAGSVGYYAHYQFLDPVPYPSAADLGWIGLYPLAYAALIAMLRRHVRRLPASVWLDGLVAAITVTAFAAAFALGAALKVTDGPTPVVAMTLAYPVADLLLLVVTGFSIAVIGRGAGGAWWLLAGGFLAFAITDTLYIGQAAADTYEGGGPLDIGWVAARMLFLAAACLPARPRKVVALQGALAVAVPGLCALASVALLYHGALTASHPVGSTLAVLAVLAALARTALTFRESRRLAESRLQARTDELTGLTNRRGLSEMLDARLRAEAPSGVALVVLDLDRFKEVNDSLGHRTGDALLRQVADRLERRLEDRGTVFRLGGDEFAAVVDAPTAAGALHVVEELRAALRDPFEPDGARVTVDGSFGIALAPDHGRDADELLQAADLAMYAAKRTASGVLVHDDQRDGGRRRRLALVEELRVALDRRQLTLEYQPKLDLRTSAITGVEALVRWRHPERGLLGPGAFLDVAESAGLMGRVTAFVLEAALAQCAQWRADGVGVGVAVNISPSNLVDESFPEHVTALLRANGLRPETLVIEVTEGHVMEDRARAAAVLARLRAAGIGVAVDDFGTGYSSLAYLAELPVTEVKLDRAFIARMADSPRHQVIVGSTVALGRALDLRLVAEGVEDAATLEALVELGCDEAQGYLIGRPAPPEEISRILRAGRLDAVASGPAAPARRAVHTGVR